MRPTAAAMLQQNNNNNHPCLSMSASTQQLLHQCSTASLPLPARLELSLGGLPLIRGLRAWALCSKNRRRAAGKATAAAAPHCPRPADVQLSGECWGLGMDARQARIGALVTVATLKTSDGGGKTQTQCLFLRSEKGSCLYSTTKPGAAAKGFLRGKSGGRDNGTAPSPHTDGNWVRVRSGRRWRKSGNTSGREKSGVNNARHLNGEEQGHVGTTPLEQKQEVTTGARPERHGLAGSQEECGTEHQCQLKSSLGPEILKETTAAIKPDDGRQHTHTSSPSGCCVGTRREAGDGNEPQGSLNTFEESEPDPTSFLSGNTEPSAGDPVPTENHREMKSHSAAMDGHFCNREEAEKETSEGSGFMLSQSEEDEADRSPKMSRPIETLEDESEVSAAPDEYQDSWCSRRVERLMDGGGDSRSCSFPKEPGGVQGEGTRMEEHQDEEKEMLENREEPKGDDSGLPASDWGSAGIAAAAFPTLSTTAAGTGGGGKRSEQEEQQEEEFGVFVQAEGERDWNQELRTPVHCGSTESERLLRPALDQPSLHWTSGWRDQSDDSWTAFSQDTPEKGGAVGQWWLTSGAEQRRGALPTNQDPAAVLAQAFPSPCVPAQDGSCSLCSVPTLRQLLGGGATPDQRLLDDFHDLNKMIGCRLKGANVASRDLLLRTLQLQPPESKNRPPVSRRPSPSPGLPSANQLSHGAAPQRRLSYDSIRNTTQ